jgi:FkbM family methyltransferase
MAGANAGQSEHIQQPALQSETRAARMARRLVRGSGPVRRLTKSRPAQRLIYLLRAAPVVADPVRFAIRQLRGGPPEPAVLRRSRQRAIVRPGTGDIVMLHQILGRDMYRPPAPVDRLLGREQPPLRIADLGANVGYFTLQALARWPAADVLAVEADPENAEAYARMVSANRLEDHVRLITAAASNRGGTVSFASGEDFRSRVVVGEVGTLAVDQVDVLPLLADRTLVKIDIEGSEWALLEDDRFAALPMRAIAMEWHAHLCPEPDAAGRAIRLLERAGFEVERQSDDGDCGTLWGWRE